MSSKSSSRVQAMPAADYHELAALVGLTPPQRAELDADQGLAAELLAHAIARAGVKQPAAYAVAAFRKRRLQTQPSSRSRARKSSSTGYLHEPQPEPGPPPEAVLERLRVEPELRALLGPVVAAALRHHGQQVPDWLADT